MVCTEVRGDVYMARNNTTLHRSMRGRLFLLQKMLQYLWCALMKSKTIDENRDKYFSV